MAPHSALEEIGADYVLTPVDIARDRPRDPEYLKINPTGQVPTLVVAEHQIITESAAIVSYLADRHPAAELIPSTTEPVRGDYYRWLFFMTNQLQAAYRRYYHAEEMTTERGQAAAVEGAAQEAVARAWQQIDAHLEAHGPFLLGERFSGCDLFLHMLSRWRKPVPDLPTRFANVARCANLVAERPAVKRMLERNAQGD
jgi:glutathione S-transferase